MKNLFKKKLRKFLFYCGDYFALRLTGQKLSALYDDASFSHDKVKWLEDVTIPELEMSLIVAQEKLDRSETAYENAEYALKVLRRKIVLTGQLKNIVSLSSMKIAGDLCQLMLIEAPKLFCCIKLNSYWIAQATEQIISDLVEIGEDVMLIKLSFDDEGHLSLSVKGENFGVELGHEISLPAFPIKNRTFKFYHYPEIGGLFTQRLAA